MHLRRGGSRQRRLGGDDGRVGFELGRITGGHQLGVRDDFRAMDQSNKAQQNEENRVDHGRMLSFSKDWRSVLVSLVSYFI